MLWWSSGQEQAKKVKLQDEYCLHEKMFIWSARNEKYSCSLCFTLLGLKLLEIGLFFTVFPHTLLFQKLCYHLKVGMRIIRYMVYNLL